LPTKADHVPTGSDWPHDVKYDGYRVVVRLIGGGSNYYLTRYFHR
jgi:bifunctional non-homologous end joining protein LigD